MLDSLKKELQELANPEQAEIAQRFFKTGKGKYGEGENFIKLIEQIKEVYNERCRYRKAKEKEEYERVAGIRNYKY